MTKMSAKKKKRNKRKKQEGWRKRLHSLLVYMAWVLPFASSFEVIWELSGCTIAPFPETIWWGIIIATMLALPTVVWLQGNMESWIEAVAWAGVGFVAGGLINILWSALFLELNHAFPRSAPYQKTAVVYNREVHDYRRGPTVYGISLRLDDGRAFSWDCGSNGFNHFRPGDTCSVTMYDGLFGFEVVKDVKVVKPVRTTDQVPEWMKTLLDINSKIRKETDERNKE